MTEQEWLASANPAVMLAALTQGHDAWQANYRRVSDRKLRLFAVACCRQVWDGVPCKRCGGTGKLTKVPAYEIAAHPITDMASIANPFNRFEIKVSQCQDCHGTGRISGLTDPRSRQAVEVAEKFADSGWNREEAVAALDMDNPEYGFTWTIVGGLAADAVQRSMRLSERTCSSCGGEGEIVTSHRSDCYGCKGRGTINTNAATQAALLREIVGNPWRPVRLYVSGNGSGEVSTNQSGDGPWWPLTPTVRDLARAIYEDRDWPALPVLWDALAEAGCDNAALHAHLTGPGIHARGCWCLDLLLGKE